MRLYAAPMEGISGYIYRNAHSSAYPGADAYYAPFISPGPKLGLKSRELRDLLPENNRGVKPIPQVLTNRAGEFLAADERLYSLGYGEINLNLGCPSGTVAAKFRGSGFLALPEELDAFLDEVFSAARCRISIKTRVGRDSPEEIVRLMEIYNRYPLTRLIVHPRVQKQQYSGVPDMEAFRYAYENSRAPVVYNGDIWTLRHFESISAQFPGLDEFMLGRGLISDPALIRRIKGLDGSGDKKRLRAFHDRLFEDYAALGMGERNTLFRMKELWCYMIRQFPDSGKFQKAINKSGDFAAYRSAVDALFAQREIEPDIVKGV